MMLFGLLSLGASIVGASSVPFLDDFNGAPMKQAYMLRATLPTDWHHSQVHYAALLSAGAAATHAFNYSTECDMASCHTPASHNMVFSPINFGGDPTGVNDSSVAFERTIAALIKFCRPANDDSFMDCGGAILDLMGGYYRVSRPIVTPAGYGNLYVQRGTLFADDAFTPPAPAAAAAGSDDYSYLLIIGGTNCTATAHTKGACSTNVGVKQLTLDARHVAGGCLYLSHTQYANAGPGIMLLGFSTIGINLLGSGGSIVHGVFAGEYPERDKRAHNASALSGTAVSMAPPQHDGYITNCIIWSAKVGVVISSGAQNIQGVHPWNYVIDETDPKHKRQTSDVNGVGIGMIVTHGDARVEGCYLDTVPLLVNFTSGTGLIVTGNLFLKNASIVMRGGYKRGPMRVRGARITNNDFHCSDAWPGRGGASSAPTSTPMRLSASSLKPPAAVTYTQATLAWPFIQCAADAIILQTHAAGAAATVLEDSYVAGNSVDVDIGLKSTRARKKVPVASSTEAVLDFSDALLFPSASIMNGTASCSLFDGEPTAIAVQEVPGAPLQLRVKFSSNWTGALQCEVDQSSTTRAAL